MGSLQYLRLINCEIELDLACSKECIISETSIISRISGNPDVNPTVEEVSVIETTGAIFRIGNIKLYVPVVTLSINDNIKVLENTKQGLKKAISWNKYRSEI